MIKDDKVASGPIDRAVSITPMLFFDSLMDENSARVQLQKFIETAFKQLHFPRKPIGEQAPADEISPPHLRGRKLPQPGSVR